MRFLSFFVVLFACLSAGAVPYSSVAKQAYLMDCETGEALYEKDGESRMAPSSMTKIMTAFIVFDAIKAGKLKWEDEFSVSKNAWSKEGSRTFIALGSKVSVVDLMRGLIVQSGNDAATALAEGVAGSELAFGELMTARAKELGAVNTNFRNPSGLPDPEHYTTAKDLALIARQLILHHPEYYPMFAERSFTYAKIFQKNRNPLLGANPFADGIKTGHTDIGGYGVVGSSIKDGRRVIMVINGLPNAEARKLEADRLMDHGLYAFRTYNLLKAGQSFDGIKLAYGAEKETQAYIQQDVKLTLSDATRQNLTVKIKYQGPVQAPIKAGSEIAQLVLYAPKIEPKVYKLYAAQDVRRLTKPEIVWHDIKSAIEGLFH